MGRGKGGPDSAQGRPVGETSPSAEVQAAIERLALKLLAAREHSRVELARKLRARGYDPTPVEAVLERLAKVGAIDESRLAELYVAERVRKGFGPLRIRGELWEKGLSEEFFDPYLDALEGAWPEHLASAHDRRFGPGLPVDRDDYLRRARFLGQRGFPAELIRRFLNWTD